MKHNYKLFILLTTFLVNHPTFGSSSAGSITELVSQNSDVRILSSLPYLEDLKSVALAGHQEEANVVLNLDPFLTPSIISFVQGQKEEEQEQIFEFLISQIENPFLTRNSLKMAMDVLLAWPDQHKLYERVNPFIESFLTDPILNHTLLAKTTLLLHSTDSEIRQKMVDFVRTQQKDVFEKMNILSSIENENRELYTLYMISLGESRKPFIDLSFKNQEACRQKFTNKAKTLTSEEDLSSFCLQYFEYPREQQYLADLILLGIMSDDKSLFDESLKYFEEIEKAINPNNYEKRRFYQNFQSSLSCYLLRSSAEENKQEGYKRSEIALESTRGSFDSESDHLRIYLTRFIFSSDEAIRKEAILQIEKIFKDSFMNIYDFFGEVWREGKDVLLKKTSRISELQELVVRTKALFLNNVKLFLEVENTQHRQHTDLLSPLECQKREFYQKTLPHLKDFLGNDLITLKDLLLPMIQEISTMDFSKIVKKEMTKYPVHEFDESIYVGKYLYQILEVLFSSKEELEQFVHASGGKLMEFRDLKSFLSDATIQTHDFSQKLKQLSIQELLLVLLESSFDDEERNHAIFNAFEIQIKKIKTILATPLSKNPEKRASQVEQKENAQFHLRQIFAIFQGLIKKNDLPEKWRGNFIDTYSSQLLNLMEIQEISMFFSIQSGILSKERKYQIFKFVRKITSDKCRELRVRSFVVSKMPLFLMAQDDIQDSEYQTAFYKILEKTIEFEGNILGGNQLIANPHDRILLKHTNTLLEGLLERENEERKNLRSDQLDEMFLNLMLTFERLPESIIGQLTHEEIEKAKERVAFLQASKNTYNPEIPQGSPWYGSASINEIWTLDHNGLPIKQGRALQLVYDHLQQFDKSSKDYENRLLKLMRVLGSDDVMNGCKEGSIGWIIRSCDVVVDENNTTEANRPFEVADDYRLRHELTQLKTLMICMLDRWRDNRKIFTETISIERYPFLQPEFLEKLTTASNVMGTFLGTLGSLPWDKILERLERPSLYDYIKIGASHPQNDEVAEDIERLLIAPAIQAFIYQVYKHFLNNGSLDIHIYTSHTEDLNIL